MLEKQTRQASDLASTTRILVSIVDLCNKVKDYDAMGEQLVAMSKRHGQLKDATTKMVQSVAAILDSVDLETRIRLIEKIRLVTEGKVGGKHLYVRSL